MKIHPTAYLLSVLLLAGCSNPIDSISPDTPQSHRIYEKPSPLKEERFHNTMVKVAQSTRQDPNYHRMALKTDEEKRWFKDLMYKLWDRQITRQQFIAQGVKRYPDHQYEFAYIANAYQNY